MAAKAEEYMRGMVTGGTLFEELGFFYLGPVDGHNLDHLLPVLRNLQKSKWDGPVFFHVVTKKGFYNGTYFNRVINKPYPFIVRGGDNSLKKGPSERFIRFNVTVFDGFS